MATNDEIIAKLPGAIEKLNETNKRAAAKAALDEKRKLADLKKQQTAANKKGSAKTREDMDAIQELKDLRADIKARGAREEAAAASTAGQAIALKAQIEKDGKVAEDNKEFQKLSYEARKEDYAQRLDNATSPAAKKQIKEDARADAKKNGSKLDKIAAGIGGLFEMGKKGLKTAALGGMALLSTLAIGGLMIALGKFLQSDTFKNMTKFIEEELLPYLTEIGIVIGAFVGGAAIAKFISIAKKVKLAFTAVRTFMMVTMLDNVKGMIGGVVGKFKDAALLVKNAFIAVKTYMLTTMLDGVKSMIGGVVGKFKAAATLIKNAFIAVQVFALETMLPAIKGMVGGVVAKFASIANKIKLAFIAVQAFMLSTMLPAITGFMVPLLPIIAAAVLIALVLYSLWEAFQSFQCTLEETGSVGEAIKSAIVTFVSTLYGIIPALFLKLVSWVAGIFGFDEFAKKVDKIDPIKMIAETISGLVSDIVDFFTNLFDFDFSQLLGDLLGKAGKLGSTIASVFGFGGGGEPDKSTKTKTKKFIPKTYNGAMVDQHFKMMKRDADPRTYTGEVAPEQAKYMEERRTGTGEGGQVQKYADDKVKRSAAGAGGGSGGPTNIVDARKSSSVTTTGSSGQSPIIFQKFGKLNMRSSEGV